MKRPDNPLLTALDATISELHAAEQNLAAAKRRLSDQARSISTFADKQERIDVAIYAYWYMPEVSANDLAWAVTRKESAAALLKHAGPMTMGIACDGCGKQVPITSRTQMKEGHPTRSGDSFAFGGRTAIIAARHGAGSGQFRHRPKVRVALCVHYRISA